MAPRTHIQEHRQNSDLIRLESLLYDKEVYRIPKKFGSSISFVVLFHAKKSNWGKMLKDIKILWSSW